jgi:hypothetical protein
VYVRHNVDVEHQRLVGFSVEERSMKDQPVAAHSAVLALAIIPEPRTSGCRNLEQSYESHAWRYRQELPLTP